jgi:hypothetical protein
MSATMARQRGRVQLEQSDMRLALNMGKMAKGGFLRDVIEETQYLIDKPRAEVREVKKRGVEFPGHEKVKAAMERHPAMIPQNQSDGCLPCQNGTARNPQTIPAQHTFSTRNAIAARNATCATRFHSGRRNITIRQFARRKYGFPCFSAKTQGVNHDALATDSLNDDDFDPELLSDERASWG